MSTEMLSHIPVTELVTSLIYDSPVWQVMACPSSSVALSAGHL